jgi:hypothetical protein
MTSDNTVGKPEQAVSFDLTVKHRLVDLGLTVTELARRIGKSRPAVSTAIHHDSMFPAVKQLIKEAIGL